MLDRMAQYCLNIRTSLRSEEALSFYSQIIASGSNFAASVIIVRNAGLEEFGLYSVCFLFIMICRNFLNGMVLAPLSTIGSKIIRREKLLCLYRGFLILEVSLFSVIASAVFSICLRIYGVQFPVFENSQLLLAFFLTNMLFVFSDFFKRHFFVYRSPATGFCIEALRCGGLIATLSVAAWSGDMNLAEIGVIGLGAGALCSGLFGLWRYGQIRFSWRFVGAVWPRHRNFVVWMTPNVVFEAAQANAPLFIAGALLGEQALGAVRAIQQLANILNLPLNSLQQVAPSIAARALTSGGKPAMRKYLMRLTISAVAMSVVLAALVFASRDWLLSLLFDMSGDSVSSILAAYLLVNVLILVRFPFLLKFQTVEKPSVLLFVGGLGGAVSVGAGWLLPQILGPVAVPVSSIVIMVVTTGALYIAGQTGEEPKH